MEIEDQPTLKMLKLKPKLPQKNQRHTLRTMGYSSSNTRGLHLNMARKLIVGDFPKGNQAFFNGVLKKSWTAFILNSYNALVTPHSKT